MNSHKHMQSYSHVHTVIQSNRDTQNITCSRNVQSAVDIKSQTCSGTIYAHLKTVGICRGTEDCQYPILRKSTLLMNKLPCIMLLMAPEFPVQRAYKGSGLVNPSLYVGGAGFRHTHKQAAPHHGQHMFSYACTCMATAAAMCVWKVSLLVGKICMVPHCDHAEGTNSHS